MKLLSLFLLLLVWSAQTAAFFCFNQDNREDSGNRFYSSPYPPPPYPPYPPYPGPPPYAPGLAPFPYPVSMEPAPVDPTGLQPGSGEVQPRAVDYKGWRFRPMNQGPGAGP